MFILFHFQRTSHNDSSIMKLCAITCITMVTMIIASTLVDGIPFRAPYRTKGNQNGGGVARKLSAAYIQFLRRLLASKYQKMAAHKRSMVDEVAAGDSIESILSQLQNEREVPSFVKKEIEIVKYLYDRNRR